MMPPVKDYAVPTGRYFSYVWDTKGIPIVQELDKDTVVITPEFDNLLIYGREIMPDPDDVREGILVRDDRILGEWFSVACPEGEVGTVAADECSWVSPQQFSAAYLRGWEREESDAVQGP